MILRRIVMVLAGLLLGGALTVRSATRAERAYEAFVTGNLNQWAQVIAEMEKSKEPRTITWKLELAGYYYGLAGYYIGLHKNDLAAPVVTKADVLLNGLLRDDPDNATALSYKGAVTAFKINLNRMKVLFLGRESLKWLNKALEADPDNVQALSDKGSALLHAPALFGGDPEEAIRMYHRAQTLMERRHQTTGNWFYLNLLLTTAKAYSRIGQPEKGKPFLERALQLEPRLRRLF